MRPARQAFLRQETGDHRPAGLASRPCGDCQCPTLVLVGDGDELTPPTLSQEIAAGIRGSRLVVIPDCGHLSTVERPQAVTLALVEWMRG
jgi:pimeloyl-ACP methyl ester carboxylesterase